MISDPGRLKLIQNILNALPTLPPDVSTSFLLSYEKEIRELFDGKKGPFCSNCSCPWSIGCSRMRLWPPPRKTSAINSMKKREEVKRISRKEKTLLSMAENKQNALVIKCKVCDYEMVNKFDLPVNVLLKKSKIENESKDDIIKTKRRKKKKRKEENAGLCIPNEVQIIQVKPKKNVNKINNLDKVKETVISEQCIPNSNNSYNKDSTKQVQKTSNNRKLNHKFKTLNLSDCAANKSNVKVKTKKKKFSVSSSMHAMKAQNVAFMRQINNKKKTLTLDSFLGSLI